MLSENIATVGSRYESETGTRLVKLCWPLQATLELINLH